MPSPNIEDVDAYSDSGSTISLASCGSGSNDFSPRPPRGDSARSKSAKGRRSRVSNANRSPYASRQQPPRKPEQTKSMGRNLWMTAMKNGTGALSTNNTLMDTWAGPRPAHANKKRGPGSRARHFSDVVDLTDGKSKFVSKSATMSYSEPYASSGGPALKPAEDYYDEIIELKKIINLLKEENNRVNTKLHRVEEENVKKPEDLRRTLTDKRGDSSSIVTSLKQKLHAVERTLKDKEGEINKMKRDLKTTDVEEMKIQSEVYYQEVQRLQLAMLQMEQERMDELYAEDNVSLSRLSKSPMSPSQQKLQKDVEALKAENKSLKKELLSAVEQQASNESTKQLKDRKSSITSNASATNDRESELMEENEKQRKIIEKLKEDRTHYRLIADDLRKQLKERESEVEMLQSQVVSKTSIGGSTSSKPSVLSTSSQYSPRKESITVKEREEQMEKEFQEFQQRHAAKVLQKQWRTRQGTRQQIKKHAEDEAAKTLQREWRKHRNQKDAESQNEAITDIQAAFRGHLTRKQRLDRINQDEMDTDDAIVDLQSALRGHLTRTRNRDEEPNSEQWSQDILRNDESLSEDDSDIVIGKPFGSLSTGKSPFSASKRSSFRDKIPPTPAPRTTTPLTTTRSNIQHNTSQQITQPSPAPRRRHLISDDKSSTICTAPQPSPNKPIPAQQADLSKPSNGVRSNKQTDNTTSTDSHSDNDLVICGKTTKRVTTTDQLDSLQQQTSTAFNSEKLTGPKDGLSSSPRDQTTKRVTTTDQLDSVQQQTSTAFNSEKLTGPKDGLSSSPRDQTTKRVTTTDQLDSVQQQTSMAFNSEKLTGPKDGLSSSPRDQTTKRVTTTDQLDSVQQQTSTTFNSEKLTGLKDGLSSIPRDQTQPKRKDTVKHKMTEAKVKSGKKEMDDRLFPVFEVSNSSVATTDSIDKLTNDGKDTNDISSNQNSPRVFSKNCATPNHNPSITAYKSTNEKADENIILSKPYLETKSSHSVTRHITADNVAQNSPTAKSDFISTKTEKQNVNDENPLIALTRPGNRPFVKPVPKPRDKDPKKNINYVRVPDDGLTKSINPQRTIDEERDDDVISSSRHVAPNRHEIVDSDDDEDDLIVSTPQKSKVNGSFRGSKKSYGRMPNDEEVVASKYNSVKTFSPKRSPREIVESEEEEEEEDVVVSSKKNYKNSRPFRKSSKEIYDSDEDDGLIFSQKRKPSAAANLNSVKSQHIPSVDSDDNDDDVVVTSKKAKGKKSSKIRGTSKNDKRDDKMTQKNRRPVLQEPDDESDDDVIVTSSKSKGSKYNTTSTPKRESLVDSLLPRSSSDNRGRKLVISDDDDDDNDDDIIRSLSKRTGGSSSASKKKDSCKYQSLYKAY